MEDIFKFLFSYATFDVPGLHLKGPFILVATEMAAFAAIFAASLVWVYRDAVRRDKNPVVAMLFILLTGWPASFIWWFWLRPPLKEENLGPESLPPLPVPSR